MDPKKILEPQQQRYYRLCERMMSGLGLWPACLSRRGRRWYTLAAWLVYFVGAISAMVHYVAEHLHEDFFQVCHLLASVLIASFAIPHLIIPLIHADDYETLFSVFYNKMHLARYPQHDDFTRKILLKKERTGSRAMIVMCTGVVLGASFYMCVPVALNCSSGAFLNNSLKLESTLSLTMPFDSEHHVVGWAVLAMVGLPIIYATPLIGAFTAGFFFFFVSHLDGHLDILKYNLTRLPRPDVVVSDKADHANSVCVVEYEYYSSAVEKFFVKKLSGIVDHYNDIISFRSLIQSVYGELLLCVYLFNMIGYCLVLLQLTRGLSDGALRYGLIALFLFAQMTFLTVVLEDIYLKLSDVSRVLYCAPWPALSARARRTLLLAVLASHSSRRFTAAGLVHVSRPVMLSIIKTTASYFAFLRTVTDNE